MGENLFNALLAYIRNQDMAGLPLLKDQISKSMGTCRNVLDSELMKHAEIFQTDSASAFIHLIYGVVNKCNLTSTQRVSLFEEVARIALAHNRWKQAILTYQDLVYEQCKRGNLGAARTAKSMAFRVEGHHRSLRRGGCMHYSRSTEMCSLSAISLVCPFYGRITGEFGCRLFDHKALTTRTKKSKPRPTRHSLPNLLGAILLGAAGNFAYDLLVTPFFGLDPTLQLIAKISMMLILAILGWLLADRVLR